MEAPGPFLPTETQVPYRPLQRGRASHPNWGGRCPVLGYTIATMMTMMPPTDAITSIPLHQSTLRVLQRVKSAAETWDEFLIHVTDDYLSPSLRAELDRRLKSDRIVAGAKARRAFLEHRKRAR